MVRHIVMFKLRKAGDPEWMQGRILAIKAALEALPADIDVIRSIRVDSNINPDEEWDVVLTAEFDTLADVRTYSLHPAHVAVGRDLIAPVRESRACVDYEF